MLFTDSNKIKLNGLYAVSEKELRDIEIRAFWAGLSETKPKLKYSEKIEIMTRIFYIGESSFQNIIAERLKNSHSRPESD
jgi:hypothetical protein